MNTYLITGGAGFIGSNLLEKLLKNNNKVIVIDNFNDFYNYKIKIKNIIDAVNFNKDDSYKIIYKKIVNNTKESKDNLLKTFTKKINSVCENFKLYFNDIRNMEELDSIFSENKIDVVIHLAAMAGVQPSFTDPLLYEEVNIKGTLNILELMKKYKLNKFIFASSSSVYGSSSKLPFSENDQIKNVLSPYAYTKKSCEELSYLYWEHYCINTIILRFFTVYGPRQRPDLAIHKFLNLMVKGEEIPFFGDGSSGRDYTYVDDIISGIIESIKYINNNNKVYEIFNLGNYNVVSLKEMTSILEEVTGYKGKFKMMDFQPGDMKITYANINKSKKLLNYNPKTCFKSGVEKFFLWYKNLS